jgi:uncharacterized membrane protein
MWFCHTTVAQFWQYLCQPGGIQLAGICRIATRHVRFEQYKGVDMNRVDISTPKPALKRRATASTSPQMLLPMAERLALALAGVALVGIGNQRTLQRLPGTLIGLGSVVIATVGYRAALEYITKPARQPIIVSRTINRPAADVFAMWQHLEALPPYLEHIDAITTIGSATSVWEAQTPFGMPLTWQAETTEVIADNSIRWRGILAPIATHTGTIEFSPAPGGRGCQVTVTLWYTLTSGLLAALGQPIVDTAITSWIDTNILRLKQRLETGQQITTQGQPAARKSAAPAIDPARLRATTRTPDEVTRDSQDSFPASDPPAWMAGNKEQL